MALIGGNGRIVAYTKDPSKFGEKVSDILDSRRIPNMGNLKRGEVTYTVDKVQAGSSCTCRSALARPMRAGP